MDQNKLSFRAMPQCTEFRTSISRQERPGQQCKGGAAQYVSRGDLYQYWTLDKIDDFLRSSGISAVESEIVREGYLIILSILTWIQVTLNIPSLHHLPELISHNNNDASLPWPEAPRGFTDRDSFHHFHKQQWRFCPILLNRQPYLSGRCLDPCAILPISQLNSDTEPKFRLDSRQRESTLAAFAINTPPDDHTQFRYVAFKTYLDTAIFEEELKAYQTLRRKNNNVVRCYGSFYWVSDTNVRHSTIILELAEEGSLRDLYMLNDPPTAREDIHKFWLGFIDLAEALEALHNYDTGLGYSIIHQDLKPSNVLVFRNTNQSQGPFQFKIGDFGSSTVRYGSHSQRVLGPDAGAGKTYGPPELHLNHTVDYIVTVSVDMWALGCIMIEAAVWLQFGEPARQRFRQERMKETAISFNGHQAQGCSDTFHDGSRVLQCVRGVLHWIERDGRRCDDITPQVVQYVLGTCLGEDKGRPISRQVVYELNKIIYAAPTTQGPHTPSKSTQRQSWQDTSPANGPEIYVPENEELHTRQRPSLQPAHYRPRHSSGASQDPPRLSISTEPIIPTIPDRPSPQHFRSGGNEPSESSNRPLNNEQPSTDNLRSHPLPKATRTENSPPPNTKPLPNPPEPAPARLPSLPVVNADEVFDWYKEKKKTKSTPRELPGWDSIKGTMSGRDYVLVIDNSKHMQDYKEEVFKLAKVLSYLMKQLDPNGVEVVFTSNPAGKTVCDTSSKVDALLNQCFGHGRNAHSCQMERTLEQVLGEVKMKLFKSSGQGQRQSRHHSSLPRLGGASRDASGVSVYVLTNGVWDSFENGTCGVENPIDSLIAYMKDHGVGEPRLPSSLCASARTRGESGGSRRWTTTCPRRNRT
ncbi:kinase-like domain-containing protein [Apiospora arundinis]